MSLISAGVAFFAMLAIFPALSALVALWALVADPAVVHEQLTSMRGALETVVPEEVWTLIATRIEAFVNTSSSALGWAGALSIALAFWSARAGVSALMRGLNAVHGTGNRGGIFRTFLALVITAGLLLVAIVALVTVVVVPIVLAALPLGALASTAAEILRWIVAIGVMIGALGFLYRYGPNRPGRRFAWITPGSLLAVCIWVAASAAFSIYLTNFGNYNEIYGSLGAVIALLVWLYFSAFLVLLGASLNEQIDAARHAADRAIRSEALRP